MKHIYFFLSYIIFLNSLVPDSIASTQSQRKISKNNLIKVSKNSNNITHSNGRDYTAVLAHDFWQTVRDELNWPIPNHFMVHKYYKYYIKNKFNLYQIIIRAQPYICWIRQQIGERGLPMELLLLPMVESAFNPHAKSKKQAAGLWQIMPQTGSQYGLSQNNWYDGRCDVSQSTSAALNLLQYLNQRFKQDWWLTLAAYNSGETRVAQAISEQKNRAKVTKVDHWSLKLPRETIEHVAKLLAISLIIKNSEKLGFILPQILPYDSLTYINVGQPFSLLDVANMAGLPLATLKSFNPGYKNIVTAPNGPYHLMLPQRCLARFQQAMASSRMRKNYLMPLMPTYFVNQVTHNN